MTLFSKLSRLARGALNPSDSSHQGANAGATDWRAMVRSAADALTGDANAARTGEARAPAASSDRPVQQRSVESAARPSGPSASSAPSAAINDADRAAIARYDYLLKTAGPEQIEQVHREAFERLTPVQREQIEQRMRAELPSHERPGSPGAEDLARAAARAEAGRPGTLRGLLARAGGTNAGGANGGPGVRTAAMVGGAAVGVGLAAGGVLAAVAGGAIVSSIAGPLLEQAAGLGVDFEALAGGIDVGGFTGEVGDLVAGAGESVSGLGDQVAEFGSNFTLPGLGDFFGR